jgi:thioredoxin reductase (NADPH)
MRFMHQSRIHAAEQAALNFSRFATTVTMLVRGESLKETLSSYLVEQIEESSNIEVLINTTLSASNGADSLESITYRDDRSGEVRHARTHWVFVVRFFPRRQ